MRQQNIFIGEQHRGQQCLDIKQITCHLYFDWRALFFQYWSIHVYIMHKYDR